MFNNITQPYDEGKMQAILVSLRNNAANGESISYKVVIDGEEVVPKTENPELLTSVFDLVTPDTKYIDYIRYQPNSRNRTVRRFLVQHTSGNGMLGEYSQGQQSGSFPADYFSLQMQNNQLTSDNKHLTNTNADLKRKLDILFEKYEKLTGEHQELKQIHDKSSSEDSFWVMAENLIGKVIDRTGGQKENPLSGTPERETESTETEKPAEDSFDQIAISKTDYKNFLFLNELFGNLTETERGQVFNIIGQFAQDKSKIEKVLICLVNL
jgi:hypothetical protein